MSKPPNKTRRTATQNPETGFNQRELFEVARQLKILPAPDGAPAPAASPKKAKRAKLQTSDDATAPHDPVGHGNAGKTAPSRSPEVTLNLPTSRVAKAFGPPGLLPGEDAFAYDAVEAEFHEIIAPRNIVEEGWVRELTDGVLEERRLSLARSVSIKVGRREGIEATVEAVLGPRVAPLGYGTPPGIKTSVGVMTGNVAATETYNDCLEKIGLTPDEHSAAVYVARLDKQLRIQTAIDTIRRRRAALLRDIESRRADMAKLLKVASERLLRPADQAATPNSEAAGGCAPATGHGASAEIDNA
jgi:hypothetical protein